MMTKNSILSVYLRLSRTLLSVGCTAYELSLALLTFSRLSNQPKVQSLPFPNTIILSLETSNPDTVLDRFESKPLNARLLSGIEALLLKAKPSEFHVDHFLTSVDKLFDHPLRHRWLGLLACVVQCFATARFFGGDWAACVYAGVASALSYATFLYFSERKLNFFLLEILTAFVAGGVAMGASHLWGPTQTPLAMLCASVIWCIPGILMMVSFSNLFHGFITSALNYFAKTTLVLFALLLGLTPALLAVKDLVTASAISPEIDWVWAGLASLACAYRFEAVGKLLFSSFLLGAIGHGLRAVLLLCFGFDVVTATFLGALAVGLVVALLFSQNRLLIVYAITIGIIPLVPGALLLKAFHELMSIAMMGGQISSVVLTEGIGNLFQAIMQVVFLAIGGILPTTIWQWFIAQRASSKT
jgi:uncharacterized membrane protein YjjP (DUF1212 family)